MEDNLLIILLPIHDIRHHLRTNITIKQKAHKNLQMMLQWQKRVKTNQGSLFIELVSL